MVFLGLFATTIYYRRSYMRVFVLNISVMSSSMYRISALFQIMNLTLVSFESQILFYSV